MQFMVSVSLNPEKAKGPPPRALAEAEWEAVRGLYMDGLVRQIWVVLRILFRRLAVGAVALGLAGLVSFAAFAWRPALPEVATPAPLSFAPDVVARGATNSTNPPGRRNWTCARSRSRSDLWV